MIQIEGLEVVGVYRRCDDCGQVKPLVHFSTPSRTNRLTGQLKIYETGRLCAACRGASWDKAERERERHRNPRRTR